MAGHATKESKRSLREFIITLESPFKKEVSLQLLIEEATTLRFQLHN